MSYNDGYYSLNILIFNHSSFIILSLLTQMLPDYPHKLFSDKRLNYVLLMEVLAMDAD